MGVQFFKQNMKRFIEEHSDKHFDVIIIGGGISGASVAYEAASRGLSVALVEKSDFASETSSATSKMIHGGIRYLSTYEFGLVRESLRERRILTNIAPNFIHPTPFIYSLYDNDKTPKFLTKVGMLLYELFSFDKGRLRDKSKKMPLHKTLSTKKVKELIPRANTEGLNGAHLYYDCSSHSPERFTLAFIKSAVKYGACVSNYTQMTGFISEKGKKDKIKIKGIKVKDLINDKELEIKGNLVINCAGPWADIVLGKTKSDNGNKHLRRSEGIHIVTKKLVEDYIFAGSTPQDKHFFVVPYRNHALIGTTDKEYIGDPDDYKVTKESIEELLAEVNSSFGNGQQIKYEDILYTYGGLRPLVEDQTEDVYNSSRKYEITDEKKNGINGLLTVEGGKFTTSRMLAEHVIDKAFKKLKIDPAKSFSEDTYLVGSEIDNFKDFICSKKEQYNEYRIEQIDYLVKSYGTEIDDVMKLSYEDPELYIPLNQDGENLGQVLYAIRNEMALTLSDIILRRTGIGLLGHPGDDIIQKIADLAAKELNWDDNRKRKEIETINELLSIPS